MKNVLSNKKAIALFVIPALILYIGLVFVPVFWSLYYSFFNGTPGLRWDFAGFSNYLRLFKDKFFIKSLDVNLKYIGMTMLGQVGLGLGLSLVFRFWLKRFKNIIRTIIFFPVVIPTVAVGQLFAKIYEIQPNYGLINSILANIGLQQFVQPWIGQSSTALISLSAMDIWVAMGFYAVIFYSALLDIPEQIIEAAKIDGCSDWQLFRHVLLPLLKPITTICLVFSFTGTVKMFESALALTNGGPGNATRSLSMYMYDVSFTYNKIGYGGTIAFFIFLLCIVGAQVINRIMKSDL